MVWKSHFDRVFGRVISAGKRGKHGDTILHLITCQIISYIFNVYVYSYVLILLPISCKGTKGGV